jgi:hypothetical protein
MLADHKQSIALENLCSRVSSYLYMGASIQMAFSLGLHRDQMPQSRSSLEREQYRRIWWTLFSLEQEIASRGGSPSIVDERNLKIDTPLPSEQVTKVHRGCTEVFLRRADTVPGHAYTTIMAAHVHLPHSTEAGHNPSCISRTIEQTTDHIFLDYILHSAVPPKVAAVDPSSPQARRALTSNAQASRRCSTPSLLELHHTPLSALPSIPCTEIQRIGQQQEDMVRAHGQNLY